MKKLAIFTLGVAAGYVISERKSDVMDASISNVFDDIRRKVAAMIEPKPEQVDYVAKAAEAADRLVDMHGPVSDEEIEKQASRVIRP